MTDESPFLEDGRRWLWSANSLDATICPRKYYYSSQLGLVSKTRKDDLIFGGYYSTACERYHRLRATGHSHDDSERQVVLAALIESHGWDSRHNAKNRETLIRSIVWYFEEYADDPCKTVVLSTGEPAAELDFRFKLSGDIWFRGRIDRLVEYAGERYVQDQKTTGATIGGYYFDRYSPNTQMSGYAFAASMVWDSPVKGVMIDAAQIAVGFTRFMRGFTFRTEAQLEEWADAAKYRIEMIWSAAEANFPLNDSACMLYGGCEFRDVCARPASVRPEFLATNFEVRDAQGQRTQIVEDNKALADR